MKLLEIISDLERKREENEKNNLEQKNERDHFRAENENLKAQLELFRGRYKFKSFRKEQNDGRATP